MRPLFEIGIELEFEDHLEKGAEEFLLKILKH